MKLYTVCIYVYCFHVDSDVINKPLLCQVYCAEGMQTLFRGNSLASKTMTYCFKAFGGNYLHTLLAPLITPMYKEMVSFEVDPTRLVLYKTCLS